MSTTITDKAGLQNMANDLTEDYVLGNAIDASGGDFTPVGDSSTKFTGTFDGADYAITNLTIDHTGDYAGLFGYTNGATIQDVTITSPTVEGSDDYVGALVGYASSTTISGVTITSPTVTPADDYGGGAIGFSSGCTISNVTITSGTVTGDDYVGGVMAYSYQDDVDDCSATCAVSGVDFYVGGFAGYGYESNFNSCYATGAVTTSGDGDYMAGFIARDEGSTFIKCYATGAVSGGSGIAGFIGAVGETTISKCYATGNVTATVATNYGAGGFVGRTLAVGVSITDCYAKGTVDCDNVANFDAVGGFIGYLQATCTITNAYSTGAPTGDDSVLGFCGSNSGTITACFWDTETSGTSTADGGTGKTTAQMKLSGTYTAADWDFTEIWNRNAAFNDGYPALRWSDVCDSDSETREKTIGPVYDDKGRVPKGARVEARRADTGAVVETEYLDSSGKATFTELPNDTDVTFWATWGGTTQKADQLRSTIVPVSEGGTGASDEYNARDNLGLGSEDTPWFTGIELGHATDTTIARDSAGKVSVEGIVLVRPANYVVAANGAPTHVKAQADYVCDATDDHVQIQAAIDALPATGGKVLLTEGTFNIETTVTLDSYQTLQGMGRSTILTTTTANVDIITATGGSGTEKVGILIADLCIDGDAGSATNDIGISWTYVDYSKVSNVYSIDNGEFGIFLKTSDFNSILANVYQGNQYGIFGDGSSHNDIIGNTCQGNTYNGIYIEDTSDYNTVNSNICQGNSGAGIYLYDSSYNTVNGNTCPGNGDEGINVEAGSNSNAVMVNTCYGNTLAGVMIDNSNYSAIVGNACEANGRYGIVINSANNSVINSNSCAGNSQTTDNLYDNIYVDGDYNLISSNLCRDGGGAKQPKYGIHVASGTGNKVVINDLYDAGKTANYHDTGTGTLWGAECIDAAELGTATYDDVQDFINQYGNRGIITGFAVTCNTPPDGTVAVAAGTGWVKTTDSINGIGVFFDFAGDASTALTDNSKNYVYLDYAGGTPVIAVDTTGALSADYDHILLASCWREGNEVHILNVSYVTLDTIHKALTFANAVFGVRRTSGLVATSTGTRNLAVSSGTMYASYLEITSLSYDTSSVASGTVTSVSSYKLVDTGASFTANDLGKTVKNTTDTTYTTVCAVDSGTILSIRDDIFPAPDESDGYQVYDSWSSFYYDGDLGTPAWVETEHVTQIDNVYYNNVATGLVALTANRYAVHWLYTDYEGEHLFMVYGVGDYTAALAEAAPIPSSLPPIVAGFGVLIAKIVVQKSSDTLVITYPWTTVFTSSLATDHNSLANLTTGDVHTQYFLLAGETTDAKLHTGADLIVYSDAGSTEKARIDGATGNITTAGTVDGVDVAAHKDRHDPQDGADPLDTANAAEISVVVAAGTGTSHSLARADHVHAINHAITDNHLLTADGTPVAGEWARFTADGLESLGWVGTTFPASPTDGMMWMHEVTGRKILYTYDLNNTTWCPIISIGAMTVYVDTAGADTLETKGHASGADAFLTVQFAIDTIPGLVGGNVIIYIGTGTFADTITIQGKNFTGAYTISIYGAAFDDTALTIDAATQGTAGGVVYGTITDNGSAWGLRATLESGNTDGIGVEANVLEDTGQNFLTTCKVGMSVKNTTDDTWAKITDVATDIRLILDTDIMDDTENYIIGWPEHKGSWITFAAATDTVALQSDVYLILENDSDTLTIVGKFDAVPAGADTAYISTLQTIISGKIAIATGQLGVYFYRIDVDAAYYQITPAALSLSYFYYCDIKSAIISGEASFVGCFIHKEDDTSCANRVIFASAKFTKCYLTSCLLDGESLHYSTATAIKGMDINNGAEGTLETPPSVIQNFYPKAGVGTCYGVYMRVNAYFAAWHGGSDCDNYIRFCNQGIDAASGAIGQYALAPYVTFAHNDDDDNADAATFAVIT